MDRHPALRIIEDRIAAVRGRARRLFILHGIGRLFLIAVGFAAGTFCFDYFVPGVPAGVRLVLLAAWTAVMAWGVYRHLLFPLRVRLSDDAIAVVLEEQYPGLQDRLISAIQLSRTAGQTDRFNSPELVQEVLAEAGKAVDRLDFGRIVRPSQPWRVALAAGLCLGAAIGAGAWRPELAGIWVQRLVGLEVRWPKRTQLVVDLPSRRVARGERLTLTCRAEGRVPGRVTLHLKMGEDGEWIHTRMSRIEATREFVYEFKEVQDSFRFWMEGGDDQTEEFEVTALTPPRPVAVRVLYTYPEYTKLPPTDPAHPQEDGTLKAPVGTRAHLTFDANVPLKAAQILVGKASDVQVQNAAIRKDAAGLMQEFTASLDILGDSVYTVRLAAENGLVYESPTPYGIRAVVDAAPLVRLLEPSRERAVTPEASLAVHFESADDYGLTEVRWVHEIPTQAGAAPKAQRFDLGQNDVDYPARKIDSRTTFEFAGLGVKDGDVVIVHAEAVDNAVLPAPNTTKTRPMKFTVVSRDILVTQVEQRESRIKEELRRVMESQQEARRQTDRLGAQAGDKDTLTANERQAFTLAAGEQRQIGQRVDRIARDLADLSQDVQSNKLLDVAAVEKMDQMAAALQKIADPEAPSAADALQRATAVAKAAERKEKTAQAAGTQDEILRRMEAILGDMQEWEDYADVVRRVRELIEFQNNLNKEMGDAAKLH